MGTSESPKKRTLRKNQKAVTKFKPKGPHKKSMTGPRTTAKPIERDKRKERLTLFDWLTVLSYVQDNPGLEQQEVVDYFATRKEGVLHFSRSALSRPLPHIQECAHEIFVQDAYCVSFQRNCNGRDFVWISSQCFMPVKTVPPCPPVFQLEIKFSSVCQIGISTSRKPAV